MKKPFVYALVVILLIILGAACYLFYQSEKQATTTVTTNPQYNPNYADAIQLKKPELCADITYALRGEPNDAITKLYGAEATKQCESQAKLGYLECECDSEAVLNNMREAETKSSR